MSIELLVICFVVFMIPALSSWVAYSSISEVKHRDIDAPTRGLNTLASISVWAVIGLLVAAMFLIGGLMLLYGLVNSDPATAAKLASLKHINPQVSLVLGALVSISAFKGIVYLFPAARVFLSKIFKSFNPKRLVHTHALIWLIAIFTLCLIQLLTPFLSKTPHPAAATPTNTIALLTQVGFQCITFVSISVIGLGLGVHRTLGQIWQRLGFKAMTPPAWRLTLLITGIILLAGKLLEPVILSGTDESIKKGLEGLFAGLNYKTHPAEVILPALGLSLFAGISEEVLFRGLLQPVFGLVLSNVLFVLVHAQYGLSPILLLLLPIGFVFGWLKNRYGLWSSIIAHVLYDFLTILLGAFLMYFGKQMGL